VPIARVDRFLRHPDVHFAQVVGLGTLLFLAFVGLVFPAPPGVLLKGALFGCLSGLTAIGIVLIYRANRIINFSQGDLGAVAGVLGAVLVGARGWNFYAGFGLAIVVAVAIGILVEVLVIRRFSRAPRLVLTVATLGIALVCQGFELAIPHWLVGSRGIAFEVSRPFPSLHLSFNHASFGGGDLFIAVVAPAALIGLAVLLRRSRLGRAIRASAESSDRALLMGIPVRRINTLVWVLAAVLSALTTILRVPVAGVPLGTVLGPALLLRALAGAVIGRMESLPVAFAGAVGLGVVENAVLWSTGNSKVVDGVTFAVVIVALLVQRRRGGRADDREASSWKAAEAVRPVPPELRRLPEVRFGLGLPAAAVAAVLVLLPLTVNPGRVYLVTAGLVLALAGMSLVPLTGWAGQISLGQFALVGFGGAVAATAALHGWNFLLVLLVGGLAGSGVALLLGLPAVRIRGLLLAVTTFAFAVSASSFFLNDEYFSGFVPPPGARLTRPILFNKFDLETEHTYFYVVLVVFVAAMLSVRALRSSRVGRVLVATRDNERAAQAAGISPVRARLLAFSFSGFLAGIAGALLVVLQRGLLTSAYTPENSIRLFSMAVFGGVASVPGVMLGATYFTVIDYFVSDPYVRLLSSGVGLLVVLMVWPGGLMQILYSLRDRFLRRVAQVRRIDVPSLTADRRQTAASAAEPLDRRTVEAPAGSALVVRGLDVSYGSTQILFGVDMHVAAGEIVALLGTNGAGKSTLLNAVAGLVRPGAGTVVFDGAIITGTPANVTASRGLVLAPGGRGAFPTLTVAENLELAGWLFHKDSEYVREATDRVLGFFPILRERWQQKAGNLSGGEQQMLVLGQAFIARPKLLMIDELSLGLAPIVVERLLAIVRAIHANGTAIVLVEQSVNVAINLAERALFMEKGEVRFDGPTAGLLERPDILRAVFLQGAASVTRHAASLGERAEVTVSPMSRKFVTRCDACGHEEPVVLEAHDLSISFGGVRAIRAVDLEVRRHQVVGIIGHNGAGKTTLFDLLSGYLTPATGRVLLLGTDVTRWTPDQRAIGGLGRSFQDAALFPSMTVVETIATSLERHVPTRDPLAAALGSPATRVSERAVRARVDELIDVMNLGAYANKFVSELSTGTRRVVDLACVLAHRPDVLLIDEPSSGVAQRETEALGPLLLSIRDQTDAAIVVIEHDMSLITSISDELVALDLGRVIRRGSPIEVVNDPRVIASYLGSKEEATNRSRPRPRSRPRASSLDPRG